MAAKQQSKVGRWIAFVLTISVLSVLFLMAVRTLLPGKEVADIGDYEPWPEEVVEAAGAFPVQDGGRIKPLETFAGYTMLRLRGARSMLVGKEDDPIKLKPTEWMLDVLFRPQVAIKQPTFRVDNSEVLELIGLEGKAKRDRYTYLEIVEARDKLMDLRDLYRAKAERDEDLDPAQSFTADLANNVEFYELLLGYFTFAREGIELRGANEDGTSRFQRVSTVMATADVIKGVRERAEQTGEQIPPHIMEILSQVTTHANLSRAALNLFPPSNEDPQVPWAAAGGRIFTVMTGESEDPKVAISDIAQLEALYAASISGPGAFTDAWGDLAEHTRGRAERRGELNSVPLEVRYNNGQFFFVALFFCFVPAVLFVVFSWLAPRSVWGLIMIILTWIFTVSGFMLGTIGTTMRSFIMERPPVGNLYDTIPFITLGILLVAFLIEIFTRRRVAIGLAPILAVAGFTLAMLYEFSEANDPNDPLVAVLRSNYWLTIHVLTITLGYSAGLLAAALGAVFVFLKLFGLYNPDTEKSDRRLITRMTYGTLCFTLLLSLVGTVLGGVWANYSWGRFWGWDPKENGALMIVLWTLFILHGRLGGYLREWGINLCAIFGAAIVTFSWWHVNFLGVGLHSYGFSDGKIKILWGVYGVLGAILVIGLFLALWEKGQADQRKSQKKRAEKENKPPELPEATAEA